MRVEQPKYPLPLGPRRPWPYELLQGVAGDTLGVIAAEIKVAVDNEAWERQLEVDLGAASPLQKAVRAVAAELPAEAISPADFASLVPGAKYVQ